MKAKIIGIMAMVMLALATTVLAGDFRILDTSLNELFEVTTGGIVSVQTALFAPTIVVNGTLFNASGATTVDFAPDSINEEDIIFATTCPSGSHLYVNGNDLACELGFDQTFITNLTTTDCTAGSLVIGVNVSGGVLCAADANTQLSDANIADLGYIKVANATQVDTNETVRFDKLAGTDCSAGQLVIGVNATGGVLCVPDGGAGIENVVEDTTPQLGGSLDLNTFDIYNAAGGITNMTIDSSGNFIITLGS